MDEPKRKPGRPPVPPEDKLELRAMRLKPSQWAKVEQYGMDWLRKLIDRAKPPK